MTKNHTAMRRVVSVVGAAALGLGMLGAVAPAAEAGVSPNWVCAYTYSPTSGKKIGKACFTGNLAQVCDLSQDGRTVHGSFGVRNVGVRYLTDGNGAASPCVYQRFAGSYVTSSSAYWT